MKTLLTDREYQIAGNANTPREELREYPSIVKCDYYEQTSSAGDWSGYLIQKLGNKYHLIGWSQSNNWPDHSFTLSTGDLIATYESLPSDDDINEAIELYY